MVEWRRNSGWLGEGLEVIMDLEAVIAIATIIGSVECEKLFAFRARIIIKKTFHTTRCRTALTVFLAIAKRIKRRGTEERFLFIQKLGRNKQSGFVVLVGLFPSRDHYGARIGIIIVWTPREALVIFWSSAVVHLLENWKHGCRIVASSLGGGYRRTFAVSFDTMDMVFLVCIGIVIDQFC